MDRSKLDAGLVAALEDAAPAAGSPALPVFVHLNPRLSNAERERLAELGVPPSALTSAQGGIATATLSPDQVRQLADSPSVRQLRLSVPLRLLGRE